MKTWHRHAFKALPLLVGLWLIVEPLLVQAGHDRSHYLVQLADGGFNDKVGDLVIEVEQGQLVELEFQWAHRSHLSEQHIIVLDGYRLETDKLNSAQRSGSLKFIADKVGTFNFKCDLECDLHDYLQRGYIKVKSAGSSSSGSGGSGGSSRGAAAARTATALTVRPSTPVIAGGETLNLMATLQDAKGVPVAKANLHFFVDAEFVGRKGKMAIGTARTDANGVAFLDYRPALETPLVRISAHFDGMGVYAESEQAVEVQIAGTTPSAYRVQPAGLEAIRDVAPLALVGVVLGIWSTYAFVVSQIAGIFRERERR